MLGQWGGVYERYNRFKIGPIELKGRNMDEVRKKPWNVEYSEEDTHTAAVHIQVDDELHVVLVDGIVHPAAGSALQTNTTWMVVGLSVGVAEPGLVAKETVRIPKGPQQLELFPVTAVKRLLGIASTTRCDANGFKCTVVRPGPNSMMIPLTPGVFKRASQDDPTKRITMNSRGQLGHGERAGDQEVEQPKSYDDNDALSLQVELLTEEEQSLVNILHRNKPQYAVCHKTRHLNGKEMTGNGCAVMYDAVEAVQTALYEQLGLQPAELTQKQLLDLGCGAGGVLLCAAGIGGYKVTGVDIRPDLVEAANQWSLNITRDHAAPPMVRVSMMADPPTIIEGDFGLPSHEISQEIIEAIQAADVIFSNNYLFDDVRDRTGSLNGRLYRLLAEHMTKPGAVLVTTAILTGRSSASVEGTSLQQLSEFVFPPRCFSWSDEPNRVMKGYIAYRKT